MSETLTVKAVQFIRPHGGSVNVKTDLPIEVTALYEEMRAAGCRFEVEVLNTGIVHITISTRDDDVDSELRENGPDVQEGMVVMLQRATWRKEAKR